MKPVHPVADQHGVDADRGGDDRFAAGHVLEHLGAALALLPRGVREWRDPDIEPVQFLDLGGPVPLNEIDRVIQAGRVAGRDHAGTMLESLEHHRQRAEIRQRGPAPDPADPRRVGWLGGGEVGIPFDVDGAGDHGDAGIVAAGVLGEVFVPHHDGGRGTDDALDQSFAMQGAQDRIAADPRQPDRIVEIVDQRAFFCEIFLDPRAAGEQAFLGKDRVEFFHPSQVVFAGLAGSLVRLGFLPFPAALAVDLRVAVVIDRGRHGSLDPEFLEQRQQHVHPVPAGRSEVTCLG